MKTLIVNKSFTYTGEQLKPLFNYLEHGVLGPSMIAWRGPCKVEFAHMIDGEDVRDQSAIAGDEMLHFVGEFFDFPLKAAVILQRLMAEMTIRILQEKSKTPFVRKGDDVYLDGKKLNISIATCSPNSVLMHFAVNIKSSGAPVPVVSLEDLGVDPEVFARQMLEQVSAEYEDIQIAAQKVKPV